MGVCISTDCKKYFKCKHSVGSEQWEDAVNWAHYGGGSADGSIDYWCCGELGDYAMFEPRDDMVYMKEDSLYIDYNSGIGEDGNIYDRPCLTVARNNYKDMTIENRFYDDETVKLYKKLTEYKR